MQNVKHLLVLALLLVGVVAKSAETLQSPDGQTVVTLSQAQSGAYVYSVEQDGVALVLPSELGLRLSDCDTRSAEWQLLQVDRAQVVDNYTLTRAKQSSVSYEANEMACRFAVNDFQFVVRFRVSNNNVAFRYEIPSSHHAGSVRVMEEYTAYTFPAETTTFLSPQSDAMIGWKRTKPSYEEPYKSDAATTEPSLYGHGYTFPALFHVGNAWVLLCETGVDSRYCASRLSECVDNTYTIQFPMPEENNGNGTSEPAFAVPGSTPWRTLTLGSTLSPIVETTIMWDVVEPQYQALTNYQYGKGTWSWILWQDESINYADQLAYVDLASEMGFQFVLIDNWWDQNIGREKIEELANYAQTKGVNLFLWYSSSGYWNDIEQSPINIMSRSIARKEAMRWLQSIGVKGIKVDFFGGDKQETMRLYEDILSDANDHELMVIFHGCTIPRGWERMYPNYVGSEAVLASENMIFSQNFCDAEAYNATLHPFIRNTIGCMEYGGSFLNKRMSRSNADGKIRRTTDCFSMATAVLFQNPVQNFALAPNNLTDAPAECLQFLKDVPTQWDETRLIEGYPGKYILLARRAGTTWYYAAVNADSQAHTFTLPIAEAKNVRMLSDNKKAGVVQWTDLAVRKGVATFRVEPQSGVVIVK